MLPISRQIAPAPSTAHRDTFAPTLVPVFCHSTRAWVPQWSIACGEHVFERLQPMTDDTELEKPKVNIQFEEDDDEDLGRSKVLRSLQLVISRWYVKCDMVFGGRTTILIDTSTADAKPGKTCRVTIFEPWMIAVMIRGINFMDGKSQAGHSQEEQDKKLLCPDTR